MAMNAELRARYLKAVDGLFGTGVHAKLEQHIYETHGLRPGQENFMGYMRPLVIDVYENPVFGALFGVERAPDGQPLYTTPPLFEPRIVLPPQVPSQAPTPHGQLV